MSAQSLKAMYVQHTPPNYRQEWEYLSQVLLLNIIDNW